MSGGGGIYVSQVLNKLSLWLIQSGSVKNILRINKKKITNKIINIIFCINNNFNQKKLPKAIKKIFIYLVNVQKIAHFISDFGRLLPIFFYQIQYFFDIYYQ